MSDKLDKLYTSYSFDEKEEVFDVFLEKADEMRMKIYQLWDSAQKDDQKLLKNMLSSIELFKTSYYESRQIQDYEKDVVILKMGRYLCTIPYAYLNTAMKHKGAL